MGRAALAIPPSDEGFRASVVGASEVAALFDASPWLTRFELWHRKNGTIATPDFNPIQDDGRPENERIYWGVKLEPLIIEAACERWGYRPLETPHVLDNGAGLGGHPDRIVTQDGRGKGVLEVKMVDWLVVKKWGDEPPLHYLLQNMTYQGLAGCVWGDMIVLVGGNELRRFQYDFRPKLFGEIEARVAEFWRTVKAGTPPPPDYSRDGAALIDAMGEPTEEIADLRNDMDAEQDALDFLAAKADAKAAEGRAEEARCRLFERIGTAGAAMLPGHRIGANMTKGSADRAAIAGEIIKGRRGYRRFDVKEIRA